MEGDGEKGNVVSLSCNSPSSVDLLRKREAAAAASPPVASTHMRERERAASLFVVVYFLSFCVQHKPNHHWLCSPRLAFASWSSLSIHHHHHLVPPPFSSSSSSSRRERATETLEHSFQRTRKQHANTQRSRGNERREREKPPPSSFPSPFSSSAFYHDIPSVVCFFFLSFFLSISRWTDEFFITFLRAHHCLLSRRCKNRRQDTVGAH